MSKQIGWQKYEDMIKKQISSPLASMMMSANFEDFEEESEEMSYLEEQDIEPQDMIAVAVPNSFYEQISLMTNYDCWLGHTNFDLTPSIKTKPFFSDIFLTVVFKRFNCLICGLLLYKPYFFDL